MDTREISNQAADASPEPVERITGYYADLTAFISRELLAFSPRKLVDAREPKHAPGWRLFLHKASFPFRIFHAFDLFNYFTFIFWCLCFMLWLAWIISGVMYFFGSALQSGSSSASPWETYLLSTLVILAALVAPVSYRTAVGMLGSRGNSWAIRVYWMLLFLFFGATLLRESLEAYPGASLTFVLSSPRNSILFSVLILWIVIPSLIFAATLSLYILFFIIDLLNFAVRYLVSALQPTSFMLLKKLLSAPVNRHNPPWKMTELASPALETLREWARDNREGTEKRVLPATVFIALLGLFLGTNTGSDLLVKIFHFIKDRYAQFLNINLLEPLPEGTVVLFVLVVPTFLLTALILLIAYARLFHNLIVQSYIIEACTLAKFTVEEKERQARAAESPRTEAAPEKNIFRRIFGR